MASGAALLFSLALGIYSIALPLLMLQSGYSGAAVGVLTAVAAISQMAIRSVLTSVLYRYPDRSVLLVAGLALFLACILPAISTGLVSLTVANLLQGLSRGCFWTGSQTHVVRTKGSSSVSALARFNFVSNIGSLLGPAIGGILTELSPMSAMGAAGVLALVSSVPVFLLLRLPPFRRPEVQSSAGGIWRRNGVSLGCWSGVTGGGWRSLLGSYVPVLLAADHSSTVIGVLVSLSYGTSTLGALVVARIDRRRMRAAVAVSCWLAGLGMAGLGLAQGSVAIAGILLGLSGIGAGALQTLGPTLAVESVDPEERGAALSASGLFRSAALFLTPLVVAGGVLVAPLGPVLVVTGVLLSLPGFGGRAGTPRPD